MAASPDPRLLQKPLMRERCCHCWPPTLFTDTVWQHSMLSTVWLLWTRGRGRKEVSQPLAPCSRTAIANAIIPAQLKHCETPQQTTPSSGPPNIWAAAATRARPDARGSAGDGGWSSLPPARCWELCWEVAGLQEDEGWGVCKQTNVKMANKPGSKLLRCQVT